MSKKTLFLTLGFLALAVLLFSGIPDASASHYNSHYDTYSSTVIRDYDGYGNSFYSSSRNTPYSSSIVTRTVNRGYNYNNRYTNFGYNYGGSYRSNYVGASYGSGYYYPSYRINSNYRPSYYQSNYVSNYFSTGSVYGYAPYHSETTRVYTYRI